MDFYKKYFLPPLNLSPSTVMMADQPIYFLYSQGYSYMTKNPSPSEL